MSCWSSFVIKKKGNIMLLEGGISVNNIIEDAPQLRPKADIDIQNQLGSLRQTANNILFLEAFRNLNWSRGYDWYVELDDVPSPFARNGVIGLPVTSINYDLVNAETTSWTSGVETYDIPLRRNSCQIQMNLIDDEKGTMFQFFERWFNSIYNNRCGVLPLNEACKTLSIYQLKSTRSRIARQYVNPSSPLVFSGNHSLKGSLFGHQLSDIFSFKYNTNTSKYGREFLVFPKSTLNMQEKTDSSPREFTITFAVAHQLDADYGDPSERGSATLTLFGNEINIGGGNFLEQITNYI